MDASEHLILLASPQAANSYWVDREVQYWLETHGHRLVGARPVIDVVLGPAGVVTAMLFLVAQLVVDGDVKFPSEREDFLRIALLGSLASLFAALYLDRALAYFDEVRDSVLRGNFKG